MPEGSTTEPQDPAAAALAALWAKRRPEVVSDLGALRALLEDAIRTPSDGSHRAGATAIAHRLHGALGVFGFTVEKTRLADVETALVNDSVISASLITEVETVLQTLPR